jgi:hypothetical protein
MNMNYNKVDSATFGLSSRIVLQEAKGVMQIIKQRKSRIIVKDAMQILDIASKIRAIKPQLEIQLLISGPICSKSLKLLAENKIAVVQ